MPKDTGKKQASTYGPVPFDVPTPENLRLGQKLIEQELRRKAEADAKLSGLDRAKAAYEAAKMLGSGALASIGSIPARLAYGPEAAEKYVADRISIPTTEKGMEYVENVGDFLDRLETQYKIPPMLPEAVALQHLTGPATKQAIRQGAANLSAPRTLNPQAGAVVIPGKIGRTQDILSAAERDANLAKMLEQSAIKDRMYHGSSNPNISQFKTGKMKKEEHYPANTIEPWAVDNRDAVFLTPDPNFSSRYSGGNWEVGLGYGPTTYPVHVQAKNPWDYDNPQHIEEAIRAYKEKYPLQRDPKGGVPSHESMRHHIFETNLRELPLREKDNWSGIEKADLQEIIKNLGHDSFFVKEAGVKNLGVYDPRTIKSATGNRGTYDLTDPDITKADGGSVHISDNPDVMQLELAGGGLVKGLAKAIGRAAESAGQKAPVLAEKELTTLQDTHTMLGDKVRARAMEAQKQMDEWNYKYAPGQHVFTEHGAKNNLPPLRILERARSGNQVMRQDHPEFGPGMGRPIIDPATGKAMRTPYEPGYRVRRQNSPDPEDYAEFIIPEKAIVGDVEMAGGGLVSKLAKLARAPAKTKQEIEAIAERIAPQVTGEYVRKKPGSAITVADKTKKQFEREKSLPVDIRAIKEERVPEPVDIEKLKGEVMIGIPGDPTVTGKTLHSVGETRLGSPAPQHGGPLYGLYHDDDHFWASGLGAARRVQNLAKEAAEQYEAPVVGKYIMMGPESINYAQHFADANLQAIDLSKMTKRQIEGFDKLIRQGSPASGPRPSFPGIEDKESAYLHMAMDPELRKHFNALMQQNTVTEAFNLPSGQDIRYAITEPALRDLETGVTGYSMGRMRPDIPASELKWSEHPTYSHDIPGHFMGQSKYPIPYELSFPDTLKSIRENPKQAGHEFGSLKMVGPRQTIDQQMIDEIRAYEDRMKQLTGKKKGGAVSYAEGGDITADDLILEERKL